MIIKDLSTGTREIVHFIVNNLELKYENLYFEMLICSFTYYSVSVPLDKTYRLVIDGDESQLEGLTPNYKYIAKAEVKIFKFQKYEIFNDDVKYLFRFEHSDIKFGP